MPFAHTLRSCPVELAPGVVARPLVGRGSGAESLVVSRVTFRPGAGLPLHIHPDCEEAMLVVRGQLEAVVGEEVRTVGPGTLVLAPRGVPHRLVNRGPRPALVVTIFPCPEPARVPLEGHRPQ